MLFVFFIEAS